MSQVTRFPNGVNTRDANHPLASLPTIDPTRHYAFFHDFDRLTVGAASVTGWHLASSGTSVGALDITDAHAGIAAFEADDVAGARQLWQWAVNDDPVQMIAPAADKSMWLATRFKVESAATNLPVVGLGIPNDDPWDAANTDSFRFATESGSDPDDFRFIMGKAVASQTVISLGDLADDTWINAYAHYCGRSGRVQAWTMSDAGVLLNSGGSASPDVPDAVLGVHFGCETIGTAGANIMSIDYILAVVDRFGGGV